MLEWIKSLFSRKSIQLNDDERQGLTTLSMMAGAMAGTGATALLVWVLRYSWPEAVANANAALLMGYLFHIILAVLGIVAIQIIAQATIAIGGKIKAAAFGASVEAETHSDPNSPAK
jgi:hypothetical protein